MRAFLTTLLLLTATPAFAQQEALPGLGGELGLTAVPGYALSDGDDVFQTIAVLDVDAIDSGADLGSLHMFKFAPEAPNSLKAHLIGRFSSDLGALHGDLVGAIKVDGRTWYRLRLGETNEWYRYDLHLDAILQYMQPTEIGTGDAIAFLAAFDKANGG